MKFYLSLVLFVLMLFAQETMATSRSVQPTLYETELYCDVVCYDVTMIQKEDAKAKEVVKSKEFKNLAKRQKNEIGNYFEDRQKNKDRLSLSSEKAITIFDLSIPTPDCQCPYRR